MNPAAPPTDHDDELKPMHPKDTKPPPEFSGARKDFMAWHESFSSKLRLRSSKWAKIIEWLKSKRERRLIDGRAKEDYLAYAQVHGQDKYVEENLETFQQFLYRYLLDCAKDKAAYTCWKGAYDRGLDVSPSDQLIGAPTYATNASERVVHAATLLHNTDVDLDADAKVGQDMLRGSDSPVFFFTFSCPFLFTSSSHLHCSVLQRVLLFWSSCRPSARLPVFRLRS